MAVAGLQRLSRIEHGKQVGGVVERSEAMGTARPGFVNVGVALEAVLIVEQRSGGDEITGRRPRQRGKEILLTRLVAGHIPPARILRVQPDHDEGESAGHRGPGDTDPPANPLAGQAVQNEQPDDHERGDDVRPVGGLPSAWILDLEAKAQQVEPHQHHAADQEQ